MTSRITGQRITATPAARQAIGRLRAARGAVMFVQSGGCCAGSVPMCFPAGEFLTGPGDVLLGEIDGCPFYIAAGLDQALRHPRLCLGVVPGHPEGFSLGPGPGQRFITRPAAAATTVEEVMTTRVISVTESAGYKDIVTLLRRYRVSAVPVLDADGRVTGVVSEADLLMKQTAPALPVGAVRLAWRLRERSKASAATAAELMTSPVVTVGAEADVAVAARLMRDHNVKRLPVIDADRRLVGIVTRTDVLSVYERPDEQIRDEVTDGVIAGRFHLNPLDFDVSVTSGIVTIAGRAQSAAAALALLSAIRNVEGTVAVRDRLSYPPAQRHPPAEPV